MTISVDHRERLRKVQDAMADAKLDGLVVTRTGGFAYVAGCLAPWRSAVTIPRRGEPELITVRNDVWRMLDQCWIERYRTWEMADPDTFATAVTDSVRQWGLAEGQVGLDLASAQHPGVISATEYLTLKEGLPRVELVQGMGVLDRVMLIKDKAEIELLRRAAEIADTGMETAFASIALGRTELEVTGYAEAAMRAAGNEFVWSVTGTELGSGYRQWYEEGFTVMPSTKRIQRGDVVTVDVHSMHECYLGDLALNAVVGNPSPEIQKLAAAWQGVANSIIDQLRPDVVISDIARNARRTADELGYGAYVTPFFGHGLGTDARIPHVITESNTAPLEANMMVEVLVQMTVPGLAGLRLETAALITEEGHELLNKVPVELRVIDPDSGRGSLRLA